MMINSAQVVYEKTAVGSTGVMRPDTAAGQTVEQFQIAVEDAKIMEKEGLIRITTLHQESQSAFKHVDLIMFTRIE